MAGNRPPVDLTVVILSKNESSLILSCIQSVRWAREIVVIDTHSTDDTVLVAQNLGARVYQEDFAGYGELRTRALKYVNSDWVFYLDADEQAEDGLEEIVRQVIPEQKAKAESDSAKAFLLPRKNIMLGKWMRYGGWYPDYQTRIFRVDKLSGWRGTLHETPQYQGLSMILPKGLVHLTSQGVSAMLAKTFAWSKEEALLLHQRNHPPMTALRFISVVCRTFVTGFIVKQAWRDGTAGFLLGIYQVFSVFITYARLWELQHKHAIERAYKTLGEYESEQDIT